MNKGIFAIFFVVAVLSISFPVNAQKTAQRVGGGYTSEGIYYEVYVAEDLAENDIVLCGASDGSDIFRGCKTTERNFMERKN